MTRVAYIPTQTPDESAFTSDRAALQSPLRLFLLDYLILVRNLRYVRDIFLPKRHLAPLPGVPHRERIMDLGDRLLTVAVVSLEAVLLFVTGPLALLLPGWLFGLFCAGAFAVIYLLELPMWGGLIVHSQLELGEEGMGFEKERWHFVNGIATSHASLNITCNRLSATFRRPIIGIHNRSFGIVGDIIECMIQRCFGYNTKDVRCAYELLKLHMLDPSVEKVVVIAHSQGGIVVSLALDRMLLELPSKSLGKLEIYTFGSAASHFNNPLSYSSLASLLRSTPDLTDLPPHPHHVVPIIEHYANELDLVPRWGVLYSTRDCPDQRYAGKVFVNMGASGHLFNQHYLEAMFPLPLSAPPSISGGGVGLPQALKKVKLRGENDEEAVGTDAEGYSAPSEFPRPRMNPFLDRMVEVDYKTATKRAETVEGAREAGFGVMPAAGEANAGAKVAQRSRRSSVYDETQLALGEGAGRTVRQLSRLWMYVGGGGEVGP